MRRVAVVQCSSAVQARGRQVVAGSVCICVE